MNEEIQEFIKDAFNDVCKQSVEEILILTINSSGQVEMSVKTSPMGFERMMQALSEEVERNLSKDITIGDAHE